jgi:AcrR family transcriptional regulator
VRQQLVLDAAITVLGTRGLRQLTHRAVDAEAGLPMGSTSNLFRTREALVGGVLERLVELETAAWAEIAGQLRPVDPDEFAAMLGAVVVRLAGPGRALTLARQAIFHEAAFHPGLQRKIAAGRAALARWGVPWLAALGSDDPERDYDLMLDLIAGLLQNELASPRPTFDPTATIRRALPPARTGRPAGDEGGCAAGAREEPAQSAKTRDSA